METVLTERTTEAPDLLLHELLALREQVLAEGDEFLTQWRPVLKPRAFLPSAVNLARYIALRRRDLRGLQEALMPLGLSSLGRCEARVLANLEIGFGRLAEIQEEILWLCEAAHVPVIWATQVLDSFVRKGTHSRAEMTAAAMAERAECGPARCRSARHPRRGARPDGRPPGDEDVTPARAARM